MLLKANKNKSYSSLDVHNLYIKIVDQARQPVFYSDWQVPDTVDGRFEMIILHMFFVLQTLQNKNNEEAEAFAQKLFDVMFMDMDRSLRERGVGDLGVPKHIKRMAQAFYGRVFAYEEGLIDNDMSKTIKKNIYNNIEVSDDIIEALTSYIKTQSKAINSQSIEAMFAGNIVWNKI